MIYHDRSAACTDAGAIIAEAWNATVQAGHAEEGQGIPPITVESQVLYAVSDDDDVCGVLIFHRETQRKALVVDLAYVEPSMRRQGVFKALIAQLMAVAKEFNCWSITARVPAGDTIVAKYLGRPVAQLHELRVD